MKFLAMLFAMEMAEKYYPNIKYQGICESILQIAEKSKLDSDTGFKIQYPKSIEELLDFDIGDEDAEIADEVYVGFKKPVLKIDGDFYSIDYCRIGQQFDHKTVTTISNNTLITFILRESWADNCVINEKCGNIKILDPEASKKYAAMQDNGFLIPIPTIKCSFGKEVYEQ